MDHNLWKKNPKIVYENLHIPFPTHIKLEMSWCFDILYNDCVVMCFLITSNFTLNKFLIFEKLQIWTFDIKKKKATPIRFYYNGIFTPHLVTNPSSIYWLSFKNI
jgi:hypothetical protein